MQRIMPLILFVVASSASVPAAAGRLESELEHQLRGAWAVLHVEAYSGCTGAYHNNAVQAAGVSARADRRFPPGELVKIDKINLKRDQLDLFLSIEEPVLASRVDGPFELFDERGCRVQLQVSLPREMVKAGDPQPILGRLGELLEIHGTLDEAESSDMWNRRRREPYPEDYERTLAHHAVWQAEQLNLAVAARAADLRAQAVRLTDRISDDPDYLAGFAAGVAEMRTWRERDCDDLLRVDFSTVRRAPSGADHKRSWEQGFDDGQELVFCVVLSDLLEGCFVPLPPLPPEG